MRAGRAAAAGLAALLGSAPDGRSAPAAAPDPGAIAHAARAGEPVRLDGRLDEPAWTAALPIGPLVQTDPHEGAPASEETEVRVLFDADTLYLGILCRDRQPRAIVATQLARDADLEADDRVLVVLDPLLDRRNGFFFEVNALGARADGQVSNNAEERTKDWDGIWDARAVRTAEGWSAEIAIPFRTLRFAASRTEWGFNVERQVKRRQETDRWAGARRDAWITNLAVAGRLVGLEGMRQGRGLDLRPFVSAGERSASAEAKAGLDVFKTLTPTLSSSLTVNTDFAETEADARQVNLTRFSLFFPEKRAFFLEGGGVFDVAGLQASEEFRPFFSRRIGLVGDVEVPILAGAKVVGRAGGYNVGLLGVRTRRSEAASVGGESLLAARLSRNLFRESWVGVLATHGDPEGTGSNTVLGADARLATSRFRGGRNLSLDLYAFRSSDAAVGRPGHAVGFKLDYPNDLWDVALAAREISDGFRARLGFVPRPGVRRAEAYVAFQPRPARWGVRQLFFEVEPSVTTDLRGRVESWSLFTAPINLRTESGEHLEANVIPELERLDAPFEISPGVMLPAGRYRWTSYRAEVNTATRRRVVLDLELMTGGFYGGRRHGIEAALTVKAHGRWVLAVQLEGNAIRLPQGDFDTRVLSGRADCNFSPNTSWSTLVQYDSESRNLGAQSRFRWTARPGRDLFLVLNRGWVRREDGRYLPEFDRGSVKLQYTVRL